MAQAISHKAGEGQAFWMLGGLYEVLVSSDETNGAATVMQMTVPPGMGPPPHLHHKGVTETVYVVEATLTYEIQAKRIEGAAGSVFRIPPDTVESFEPKTRTRVVITYEPGGIEKFFAEVAERAMADAAAAGIDERDISENGFLCSIPHPGSAANANRAACSGRAPERATAGAGNTRPPRT